MNLFLLQGEKKKHSIRQRPVHMYEIVFVFYYTKKKKTWKNANSLILIEQLTEELSYLGM